MHVDRHPGAKSLRAIAMLLTVLMAVGVAPCAHARQKRAAAHPHTQDAKNTSAQNGPMTFRATAYVAKGRTTAGTKSKEGVVAADPKVLPLGSRIRIVDAGE